MAMLPRRSQFIGKAFLGEGLQCMCVEDICIQWIVFTVYNVAVHVGIYRQRHVVFWFVRLFFKTVDIN